MPAAVDGKPTERKSEADVPEDERQFVGKLLSKITRAVELRKNFDEKVLPKLRRAVWGTEANSLQTEATVRANLTYATLATMLPHVYAKNPEIAITPTEAVDDTEFEKWRDFCKTAQIFLNRTLVEEAGLKRRAKANVRSAMTTGMGWLKMIFQENIIKDPLIEQRQNDMQDNLRKVETLIAQADDEARAGHEARREEIKQMMASHQQSNEVRVFKGFAVDRVRTEDMFILDEAIIEFDDYVNAKLIAHRLFMDDETYEQTFGSKPLPGATSFGQPSAADITDDEGKRVSLSDKAAGAVNFRAVFEVWDKTANRIYTVAMGNAGYCRAPYTPDGSPQRWYPFYGLAFNLVEGRFRPVSDVELIQKLQDEYSQTRHLYAEARKEAVPVRVFRKGGSLTEEDIDKLSNRRARQWIGIEGNPQTPLAQEFMQLDGVKIDAAAYDVTLIRNDIDMMVGLSDASRSNLIKAKTATEAEIMQQGLQNRVAERQDTNEDLVSDMAVAALEIALQKFSKAEIEEVVGKGTVWREDLTEIDIGATEARDQQIALSAQQALNPLQPQPPVMKPLSVEAIFHRIRAAVRAGSTGRPNQAKEREQWTQLLPVINETMQQVGELRMQGQFDLADSKVELLRETLRRYDERIDVDAFIPRLQKGEDGKPVQQAQEMQAMQQKIAEAQKVAEELQKTQEQLQQCEQDLAIAKHAQEARIAEADAQHAMKTADATAKTEIARAEEMRKESVEKERLRMEELSRERIALESSETARYTAILSMGTELYKLHFAPQPPAVGPDGQPVAQAPEPNIENVMTQITTFAERVTEVADRIAGTTT